MSVHHGYKCVDVDVNVDVDVDVDVGVGVGVGVGVTLLASQKYNCVIFLSWLSDGVAAIFTLPAIVTGC